MLAHCDAGVCRGCTMDHDVYIICYGQARCDKNPVSHKVQEQIHELLFNDRLISIQTCGYVMALWPCGYVALRPFCYVAKSLCGCVCVAIWPCGCAVMFINRFLIIFFPS